MAEEKQADEKADEKADETADEKAPATTEEGGEGEDGEKSDDRKDVERRYRRIRRKKRCRFQSPDEVDYKDLATLQKLVTAQGKIMSRKRTGNDAPCQAATMRAIKRARFLALLPYTAS